MYRHEIEQLKYHLDKKIGYRFNFMDKQGDAIYSELGEEESELTSSDLKYLEKDEILYKKNIYIPIFHKNNMEYILGLQGEKEEIIPHIDLIKGFLELVISENRKKSEETLHREMRRTFVMEILNMANLEYFEFIEQKSKLINFDLSKKRNIILVDIINFLNLFQNNLDIIQNIREVISSYLTLDEYCYELFDDKFIIIKNHKTQEETINFLNTLYHEINKKYNLKIYFIVSEECNTYTDYPIQYKNILDLHKLYAFKNKPERIIYVDDNEVEILLKSVSEKDREIFLKKYLPIFHSYSNKKNDETLATIKNFFKNNMNTLKTSQTMFVHKNTVNYRLKKFVLHTGIDIYEPYECMKIYIALSLYEGSYLR